MVELKIYLTEGLNERFRRIAMTVYGYGRGSLSKAAEEAFEKWCTEHDGQKLGQVAKLENEQAKAVRSGMNPDERNTESKDSERIIEKETGPVGQNQ